MAIGPSCSQVKIDEFIERTTLYSGEPKCFDIEIIADAISHKSPALSGQHSQVVSAQDTFDGSTVVIKSYNKAKMQHGHIRNVQREIDVMVVLGDSDCKGVVRMLYAFEDEESYHLVYEPCMRGDLYQMKCRQGTLDENYVALSVVIPLLSTLSVLHSLSIVHRDIKAENIFVSATGELRLGDFGLAAHTVHDPLVDRVGTLDYMAPEVLSLPIASDLVKQPSTSDHASASAVIVTAFKGRTSCEGSDKREKIRKQLSKNSERENVAPSDVSRSSLSSRPSADLSQLRSVSEFHSSHSPRSSPSHDDRASRPSESFSRASPSPSFTQAATSSYNEKVDIWAVGVLVFELMLGKTPFEVDDPKDTAELILKASIAERFPSSSEMSQLRGGKSPLSSECRSFISAALEKRPEKRPTAAQLLSHEWLTSQTKKARPNSASHRHQNMDVAVVGKAMNDAWGSSMKLQREDATRSISFTLQRAGPGVARSAGSMTDLSRTPPSGTKRAKDQQSAGPSAEKPPLSPSPLTASNLRVVEALNSPPEATKDGSERQGDGGGSDSDHSLGSVETNTSQHAWQAPPVASKATPQPLRKSRFAS